MLMSNFFFLSSVQGACTNMCWCVTKKIFFIFHVWGPHQTCQRPTIFMLIVQVSTCVSATKPFFLSKRSASNVPATNYFHVECSSVNISVQQKIVLC